MDLVRKKVVVYDFPMTNVKLVNLNYPKHKLYNLINIVYYLLRG